jgi:predicted heme/steroid binding protein
MNKKQVIALVASCIISLLIVGTALLIAHSRQALSAPIRQHPVHKAELLAADGKHGHECLVAVDGIVYKIEGFSLWQNGVHTSSKGLAYCGADLSKVIDKAPHGRSILRLLITVGPLVP